LKKSFLILNSDYAFSFSRAWDILRHLLFDTLLYVILHSDNLEVLRGECPIEFENDVQFDTGNMTENFK